MSSSTPFSQSCRPLFLCGNNRLLPLFELLAPPPMTRGRKCHPWALSSFRARPISPLPSGPNRTTDAVTGSSLSSRVPKRLLYRPNLLLLALGRRFLWTLQSSALGLAFSASSLRRRSSTSLALSTPYRDPHLLRVASAMPLHYRRHRLTSPRRDLLFPTHRRARSPRSRSPHRADRITRYFLAHAPEREARKGNRLRAPLSCKDSSRSSPANLGRPRPSRRKGRRGGTLASSELTICATWTTAR